MSDERPDEFFSWRSRLGPPDALPEQGLDNRDQTWEKLARRLDKTPGRLTQHRFSPSLRIPGQSTRRRFPAYRVAAACLLLLLIPASRLFHNHHPATPHLSDAVASHPPTSQPNEITAPILRSGPTPKELARLRPVNNRTNKTRLTKPAVAPPSPQNQSAQPVDSLSSPANIAVTPAPKTLKINKLRIVHVNELDNTPNPQPAMTSIRSREPDIRVLILLKNH